MESIINSSETNNMPLTDNDTKINKRTKKGSTEINKSDDQIADLKDCDSIEVVGNGKGDSEQNVNMQMQLQYANSLNMIEGIKKIISEFEQNCLKIPKLAPECDLASLMRNFDFQKLEEQNKCIQESNSDKPSRSELIRKHDEKVESKKSENVSDIRILLKNCKSAISSLEKKLEDKAPIEYLSESPSESEEEQSSDSAYDPRNTTYVRDSNRKRRQPNRVTKAGRKSRGRPRKLIVDDQSSNSVPEKKEKKFRGRPRKTIVDEEKSSLSNGDEPPVKKSRGRPKKYEAQENINESSSVKESNDNANDDDDDDDDDDNNNDDNNKKQESESGDSKEKEDSSNEKNTGDSTELSETQKDEIVVKKQKGRPRKYFNNEIEVKDKKPRGRPKSNLITENNQDASETANNDSVVVKSRGRPKKNKIVENEQSNSTSN